MLEYLASNLSTIIVALVVFGVVGLDIYKMVKDARAGKHSCSGDCSNCGGNCGSCH